MVQVSKSQQVSPGFVHVSPTAAVHIAPGGTAGPLRGVAPAGTGVGGLLGTGVSPQHKNPEREMMSVVAMMRKIRAFATLDL